jgi:adenosylhomocysteine nucleosidase
MSRIGVIAAMPGELKPLVQGWKPLPAPKGAAAWQGTIGGATCIAVCAGMGKEAAERACAIAAQDGPLTAFVSAGWAGALSCGMQAAGAYVVNEVVDTTEGKRFATSSPPRAGDVPPLRLVTIDHVALPAEKRRLAETYQAVLVDMEAATVARIAAQEGIAFYCLKAVSDVAGEMLPDFSRYTDNQGQLQLAALLAHVAIRPRYWPALARIGKNGRRGAVAMATALGPMLDGMLGGMTGGA